MVQVPQSATAVEAGTPRSTPTFGSRLLLLLTGVGIGCLILQVLNVQNKQTGLEEMVQRLEEKQRANQAFVGYYPQPQVKSPLNMMQNQRDEASMLEYSGDSGGMTAGLALRSTGENDGASSSLRSEVGDRIIGDSTDGRAVERGAGGNSKEKEVRNYGQMRSIETLKEVKRERSGLCIIASLSIGNMKNFTPNFVSASLGVLNNIALRSIRSQELTASIKMSEIDISLSDWQRYFESREALETFFNMSSSSHHAVTFNGINRPKFDSSVGCKWYARVRLDADDALGEGFYKHLADVVMDQILEPSKGLWLGALVAFSCVERLQMAMGRCQLTTNFCSNPSRHQPQGYTMGQTRLIRYDLFETHYDKLLNGGMCHLAAETLRNNIMLIMNITDYKSELSAHNGNESYAAYDELKSRVKLINLFNNPDRRLTPFYFQTALSGTFPWHSVANFPECTKEQQQRILHERNLSSEYEFLFKPDFTRNVTIVDSCKSNHYFVQKQTQLMQKYGNCDNMMISLDLEEDQITDPQPTFETSSQDIGKAIDLCIEFFKQSVQPCSIFHLTPNGVYMDFATSKGCFERTNLTGALKWTHAATRSSYIAGFLRQLNVQKNSTLVFYHRDTIPQHFNGYPIITHTTQSHQDFILFPTPYMLRDLNNGELSKTLLHCSRPHKEKIKKLQDRIHDVYFRGHYRNDFRLQVAHHYGNGSEQLPFNVQFTVLPNGSNLTKTNETKWTDKMDHEYLLTLRGGYSSQWSVYQDYIAAGVIVRESSDKKEFWNYDLITHHSHNFVNFDTLDSIADEILSPNIQKRKQEMADFTSRAACFLLQPEKLHAFGQKFIEQYSTKFQSFYHGKTYLLSSGREWRPELVELPLSN